VNYNVNDLSWDVTSLLHMVCTGIILLTEDLLRTVISFYYKNESVTLLYNRSIRVVSVRRRQKDFRHELANE